MNARTVQIFLSAEDSLRRERDSVFSALQALQRSMGDNIVFKTILVDETPVEDIVAARHAGAATDTPDILISLVSARLGPSRPRHPGDEENGAHEGSRGEALKLAIKGRTPTLLLYRKTGNGIAIRSEISASLKQKKAFNEFVDDWFGGSEDSFDASFEAFATVDELERRVVEDLERVIRRHIPAPAEERIETGTIATWTKGSPFPGLVPYGPDYSEVFFGRQRAVREVTRALIDRASQGRAFILVAGMSACGKTSLIEAGVIPALTEPGVMQGVDFWRTCRFDPGSAQGNDLFGSLAEGLLADEVLPELAEGGVSKAELADLLREAPKRAGIPLRMALSRAGEQVPAAARGDSGGVGGGGVGGANARLLLFVDQLERLFSLPGLTAGERRKFAEVLSALAQTGQVWVIAAVGSDHLAGCREIEAFSELMHGTGEYRLLPPNFAEYGQIIRGPARAGGLQFETDPESGERLDDILHQAAIADPGGLALLQLTLHKLHKRIRADDRLLTFNAYRRLGGLEGVVAQRAEEVFAGLDPAQQAALPALLRSLVTVSVDDTGRPEARTALMSDLRVTPERSRLLDAFIAARLVNADEDRVGRPVARLANQAMLLHWPRVREWLREDQSFLRARATLINAARYWRQQSRNPDFLLSEGQSLAEHESLPDEWREYLDAEAVEYVEASIAATLERRNRLAADEDRRQRRLTWTVAVLVGVIAAASAIGGYLSYDFYLRM